MEDIGENVIFWEIREFFHFFGKLASFCILFYVEMHLLIPYIIVR
jgi:hypothetical protein